MTYSYFTALPLPIDKGEDETAKLTVLDKSVLFYDRIN